MLGGIVRNAALDVDQTYQLSLTLAAPPQLEGQFHVYVATDADDEVFENALESNNLAKADDLLEVMPTAYADLVVPIVGARDKSGKAVRCQ